MNASRVALAAFIGLSHLSAAEDSRSREAQQPDVVMPVIKVTSSRLARFGILNQKFLDRDGQGAWRLLIWRVPTSSDGFSLFVGGAQVGDEIVSINGREVATIPKNERPDMLRGHFKIVVKRPAGRRSFKLLELDGRGK